ncbi:nucleoid occlusion protein [Rubeoparvulum massiliense]|uniref:nucleoid occlusion protein n=1 Tax=Rubeoparvulum massiliense TaxID=1631346 RepID=UPI00065E3BCA|nr:nucleoid occlusion protein [Rubeoparvulum massiliense]
MKDHISRLLGFSDAKQIERPEQETIHELPVDRIVPNPYQPRTVFDDEKLNELCQTIKTHGIIQPIVVRTIGTDSYELIAGERRLRATKKLGFPTIPAIIRQYNDTQTASIALIENLQREGLTAIEEALAYQKLLQIHGLTQESLAQRLGKGQATIANKLRLLRLPETIQEAILERKITERHARALLPLQEEELQLKLCNEIIDNHYNVKQTEQRVEQILERTDKAKPARPKRISYSRDMRLAINTVRQSLDMVRKNGLSLEAEEADVGDYYQFVIRIPKAQVK